MLTRGRISLLRTGPSFAHIRHATSVFGRSNTGKRTINPCMKESNHSKSVDQLDVSELDVNVACTSSAQSPTVGNLSQSTISSVPMLRLPIAHQAPNPFAAKKTDAPSHSRPIKNFGRIPKRTNVNVSLYNSCLTILTF